MKKCIGLFACCMLMSTTVALAHHPLEEINEEIFLRVDEMIADTPHAEMVFDDMGGGNSSSAELVIITDDMTTLSNLIDDGLFNYVDQLVGVVTVTIEPAEIGFDVITTISLQE
ncbi:hypothetical protein [Desulfopila aestuarii]|uniref:Uncharacterized protein n=1 Tax=Desulfopila aestuarii DSM 18488 TaxID=1121416 RepID=A0A1M7XXV5_9BACT|nr:hypothetical protein [Desulfopila aestuarii]SHO43783.1 hypothetical protein SAMN02745220_00512 [Desulfopila aestuarii DSM 18488]